MHVLLFQDTFKQGTVQYERLMAWMLENGHGKPIALQSPQLMDLKVGAIAPFHRLICSICHLMAQECLIAMA